MTKFSPSLTVEICREAMVWTFSLFHQERFHSCSYQEPARPVCAPWTIACSSSEFLPASCLLSSAEVFGARWHPAHEDWVLTVCKWLSSGRGHCGIHWSCEKQTKTFHLDETEVCAETRVELGGNRTLKGNELKGDLNVIKVVKQNLEPTGVLFAMINKYAGRLNRGSPAEGGRFADCSGSKHAHKFCSNIRTLSERCTKQDAN